MYNKIIVVGRLTKSPELKQTPSGVSVCAFSVAVDRAYKSKGGEKQTDFFDVVAWRVTGEFIAKYFDKGQTILLEGTMESRSYTDGSGNNRRVWELNASEARFVESKKAQGTQASASPVPALASPPEGFVEVKDDGSLPF